MVVPALFSSQFQRLYNPEARMRFNTRVGSGVVKEYTPVRTESGILELVESGEHNLYQDIQSHKDSCDLQVIINRYFNGDPAALSRMQGVYMDISGVPDNLHEAMQLIDNARHDFDRLPVDIKQQFGNDANQFLATLGTADWFDKMQVKRDEPAPVDNGGDA